MAILNVVNHLEVCRCKRILLSKAKGWIDFLMLNVLEAKIFHYVFLEGHNVWENNHYWLSTQRNVVTITASNPEFLVTKGEIVSCKTSQNVNILQPLTQSKCQWHYGCEASCFLLSRGTWWNNFAAAKINEAVGKRIWKASKIGVWRFIFLAIQLNFDYRLSISIISIRLCKILMSFNSFNMIHNASYNIQP